MSEGQKTAGADDAFGRASLVHVLNKNAHIEDVVEECAHELSSANEILKREIRGHVASADITTALEQSESVENKVEGCAEQLSSVNRLLENEIYERQRLESEMALLKAREHDARYQALHDPLTALPNRTLFNDRLDYALAQAIRHQRSIAVMFVDLDDFKSINDSYGHDVGDAVLKIIARRLQESVREEDTVSRQGGDEFLYLFIDVNDEVHIAGIARKILEKIGEPCTVRVKDLEISPVIGASIGIALFPKNASTAEALINSADSAMYRAKRSKTGYTFAR